MKKHIVQIMLCAGIVCGSFLDAKIEFLNDEVFIPERLDDIKLYKDCGGFHIVKNDQIYDIQNCFCDPILRTMSDEQLMKFLGRGKPKTMMITPEALDQIDTDDLVEITGEEREIFLEALFGSGYVAVSRMDDGEYSLRAKIRLLGGGFCDKLKIFAVAALDMVIVVSVGALVGGGVGSTVAFAIKQSLATGACIGAAAGGGLGIVTESIVGIDELAKKFGCKKKGMSIRTSAKGAKRDFEEIGRNVTRWFKNQ